MCVAFIERGKSMFIDKVYVCSLHREGYNVYLCLLTKYVCVCVTFIEEQVFLLTRYVCVAFIESGESCLLT